MKKLFITTGLISLVNALVILKNKKETSSNTLAVLSFKLEEEFINNVKKIAEWGGFNEVLFFKKNKKLKEIKFDDYDEIYTNPISKLYKVFNRHKGWYLYDEGPAVATEDLSRYKNLKGYFSSYYLDKLECIKLPKNTKYLKINKEDFLLVSRGIVNLFEENCSLNTEKNLLFIGHYIYRKLGDEFVFNYYKKYIDYFINLGFNIYFKAHPRAKDTIMSLLVKHYENNKNFNLFDSALPVEVYDYNFDIVAGAYSGVLVTLPHYRNIPAVHLEIRELYKGGVIGYMTKKCCALYENYTPSLTDMESSLNRKKEDIYENYQKIISEKETLSKNEKLKKVIFYKPNIFKDIFFGLLIYCCFFNKSTAKKVKIFSRKDFDLLISQSINAEF